MNIIPLLVICSLSLGLLFLGIFFWWVKSGQGNDLVTPAYRVLFDDEPAVSEEKNNSTNTELKNNQK